MADSRQTVLEMVYGRWGAVYRNRLKEHDREKYYTLLSSHELHEYITKLDVQAEHLYDDTVEQLKEKRKISSALEKSDPGLWQSKMNAVEKQAEELVLRMMILSEKESCAKQ